MSAYIDLFTNKTRGSLSFVPRTLADEIDTSAARILQRALELTIGTVDLIVTDNRRRMVSARNEKGRYQIRVHHMFVGCRPETFEHLVGFIENHPEGRKGINQFIAGNNEAIRKHPRHIFLQPEGEIYNLETLKQNMMEFLGREGLDNIEITWGRYGYGRRSIRLGSFDFSQRLIRIHPILDAEWVPEFFVEYIVYHELLHALFPPDESKERRALHPPEFRSKEKLYPFYDEAIQWEEENLDRLLKA